MPKQDELSKDLDAFKGSEMNGQRMADLIRTKFELNPSYITPTKKNPKTKNQNGQGKTKGDVDTKVSSPPAPTPTPTPTPATTTQSQTPPRVMKPAQ